MVCSHFLHSKCCQDFFLRSTTSVLPLSPNLSEEETTCDSLPPSLTFTTKQLTLLLMCFSSQQKETAGKKNLHQRCLKDLQQQSSVLLWPAIPAYFNYRCAGEKERLKMTKKRCALVSWKPYLLFDHEFHPGFKRLFFLFPPVLSFGFDTQLPWQLFSMHPSRPCETRFFSPVKITLSQSSFALKLHVFLILIFLRFWCYPYQFMVYFYNHCLSSLHIYCIYVDSFFTRMVNKRLNYNVSKEGNTFYQNCTL